MTPEEKQRERNRLRRKAERQAQLFIAWAQGLLAAAISSAATSISVAYVDPEKFNLTTGLGNLGKVALISGVIGACLYLAKSPLPGYNKDSQK